MRWFLVMLFTVRICAADLAAIRQETNLERRSQLAMDYAGTALDAARGGYQAGDMDKTEAALKEVQESVELAYQSILDTGKVARRSPGLFKRAELATRQLLRRIEGFADSMGFQDRPLAEKVRDRVGAVHDDLVNAMMSNKRK